MNLSSVCSASGVVHLLVDHGERGTVQHRADDPGDQQHRDHADDRPAHRVGDGRRAPGDRGPHGGADGRRDELPDHGEADQQDDRDDVLLGLAADQGAGDGRAELGAEQRAADETQEAEDADDEALPVARHGERDHDHDQDEVEHITAHDLTVKHFRRCQARARISQVDDDADVPGPLPAAQRQQAIHQRGGEAPDQHPADPERRTAAAGSASAASGGWPDRPVRPR